ncbi:GNAT family N-acetyltransferase [Paenibacillus sp. SAF-068]|uniref:GNAT family N-acetyltransferase n=1 Tax=Paenibacillus sp. SAF-068 TaxID=3436864 RepID=UPI003F813096
MDKFEIKHVTAQNRDEVLNLRVKSTQVTNIETTQECLEEADECEYYQPAGLYWNDMLVGFAMYGYFPPIEDMQGRVWLDRFLIDEKFQGKGLGKKLLCVLIQHLFSLYRCNEIYLSLYEHNREALQLYQQFDFKFNGELDFNGEMVMVKEINALEIGH